MVGSVTPSSLAFNLTPAIGLLRAPAIRIAEAPDAASVFRGGDRQMGRAVRPKVDSLFLRTRWNIYEALKKKPHRESGGGQSGAAKDACSCPKRTPRQCGQGDLVPMQSPLDESSSGKGTPINHWGDCATALRSARASTSTEYGFLISSMLFFMSSVRTLE